MKTLDIRIDESTQLALTIQFCATRTHVKDDQINETAHTISLYG